jgi:alpha-ketoglutarate-dependent taurine dioxygenase
MRADVVRVAPARVPLQQTHHGRTFPFALGCESSGVGLAAATAWVAANRGELIERTTAHGAVLFRGFPLSTAEDFDAFVTAFALPNFPYYESLSNAVRVNRTPRVFTANEAPPGVSILLHHEMAQTPLYPRQLFFFCEQPAADGGATPLCRSDVLWERLADARPDFAHDCERKGLRYSNVMPAEDDLASGMGRSWQNTLKAGTRSEAERRLRVLGYSWNWLPDGCLRATTPVLPAVRTLSNGRKSFFNQLTAAFRGWKDSRNNPMKAITFGDGSPLDRDAVLAAAEIGDGLSFDLGWEHGDVVLVDNYMTMHGRRTFAGTRKILASLTAAES